MCKSLGMRALRKPEVIYYFCLWRCSDGVRWSMEETTGNFIMPELDVELFFGWVNGYKVLLTKYSLFFFYQHNPLSSWTTHSPSLSVYGLLSSAPMTSVWLIKATVIGSRMGMWLNLGQWGTAQGVLLEYWRLFLLGKSESRDVERDGSLMKIFEDLGSTYAWSQLRLSFLVI